MNSLNNNLFEGKRVRLAADETEVLAEHFARWHRDSEFSRLLDSGIARTGSKKSVKEWVEKNLEKENPANFEWMIHTVDGDQLIGFVGLEVMWNHRDAFVFIGIGERGYWSKGYGTEAMQLALRYAFQELDLERVSLDVFEYNPRAIRSYEKAGFRHEGRMRGLLNRNGRRWDMLFMGILREEWDLLKEKREKNISEESRNGGSQERS